MKIVFMGTPEFAVPSLKILLDNAYRIVAVVTAPDKPAGRGKNLQESAVKKFALERGLKVLQPTNLKDEGFLNQLKALEPELQIVVAFRMLPERVWNLPPLGTYNLHASLLPKYRGAAPINRAIMNGETQTGVSTFKLQHDIDSGNILLQEEVTIGEAMTAGELHDKLMEVGANVLLKTVQLIEEYRKKSLPLPFKIQNESDVSHAPKLHKDTCRINWNDPKEKIINHIRGLSPYPAAFTNYYHADEKPLAFKIYKAKAVDFSEERTNGTLIDDAKRPLLIKCAGGAVQLLEIQQEGKKRMNAEAFLRGFKWQENAKLI
ncbi:MAG: methionyl-tRNA formyltransferase [Bacteroidia bacterium]|nr:methionyl-tRNA formyltransferase [Bacteroidia bacterium]